MKRNGPKKSEISQSGPKRKRSKYVGIGEYAAGNSWKKTLEIYAKNKTCRICRICAKYALCNIPPLRLVYFVSTRLSIKQVLTLAFKPTLRHAAHSTNVVVLGGDPKRKWCFFGPQVSSKNF